MYRKYTPSGFVGIETRVRLRTRVLIPTYPRGVYSCTFSPSGGYYQYPLLCIDKYTTTRGFQYITRRVAALYVL